MKTFLWLFALICAVLQVDAMRSAPVLKDIPRRQHAAFAARMVARNLSIALEFEQTPHTSGAIFSIYAGPLPVLLITSVEGHLLVEYLSHEKSELKCALRLWLRDWTIHCRVVQQPGTRCFDDGKWHNLYIDVQSTQCVITVDCQVKDFFILCEKKRTPIGSHCDPAIRVEPVDYERQHRRHVVSAW